VAHLDPWEWTLRELADAAQFVRDDAWDQTCDIIAHLGSALTGEPQSRNAFHPFREDEMVFNPDDPEAEYDRLVAAQAAKEAGR